MLEGRIPGTYPILNGSRAWGWNSPESDWDYLDSIESRDLYLRFGFLSLGAVSDIPYTKEVLEAVIEGSTVHVALSLSEDSHKLVNARNWIGRYGMVLKYKTMSGPEKVNVWKLALLIGEDSGWLPIPEIRGC